MPARLLLVDDDESVLLTMQAILEAAGHQVDAAGTLAEALAEAQREDAPAPIDVVVSDLHLDEGDGLQVIAAAKRREPTTTGIIITGYGSFEAVTRAVRAGVDDFLVKPTDVDELKRSIVRCVEKAREARALAARAQEAEAARRAEAALRESEARFRLVANVAPVMIWAADPDGACTFLNRRWLEFTGRALEEELGQGWFEGIHPEDREYCQSIFARAYSDQTQFTMEYRLRSADGTYRWVQDDGAPYTTLDGAFGGFVGACVDVNERKRAVLEREALLRRERAARVEAEAEAELARAEADAATLMGGRGGPGTPPPVSPPLPPSGVTNAPTARPAPGRPPTSAVGLARPRPRLRPRPEPPKPPSSARTGEA
ncbi:MAG TPA: PAS domain S-box protein [Chloroflexota bacterium]|nr:PAS domain S-box protein [Chloroflexota bacterium]